MWLLMGLASANETTCGTLHHWDAIENAVSPILPPPPPSGDLEIRDPLNLPNVRTSEHFAFFWGDEIDVSTEKSTSFLEALEEAWDIFVDDVGFDAPFGSNHFYFNVYLMDLADPHLEHAGGYYSTDNQGFPFIAINPSYLQRGDEKRKSLVFHEFYHAMQLGTGVPITLPNRWYIEGSAEWVQQYYLQDTCPAVGAFLLKPQITLRYFAPLSGEVDIDGRYVYGSCLLLTSMQDDGIPPSAVHRSWIERDGFVEDWWDDYLSEQGSSFAEAFGDMAAKNVNLLYSENYYPHLEGTITYYPDENFRYADVIFGQTDGWVDAPTETLPEWYGYNHIRLQEAADFQMLFGFEGEAVGSAGTPARWKVHLVTDHGYKEIELDENHAGDMAVEGLSTVNEGVLSVVAYGDEYVAGETFAYRYTITPNAANSYKPFGCQSVTPHMLWCIWGGVFGLVWRRKRKRRSPQD